MNPRALSPAQIAAAEKRVRRAAKAVLSSFRVCLPTNSPGAVLARGEVRRKDREEKRLAFNHESAAGARLRHKADRKKRVPKKAFEKKPYDPVQHLHPRHLRARQYTVVPS